MDLLTPYKKGGKIGLFGGAGVGKTVVIMSWVEGNDLFYEMQESGIIRYSGINVMQAKVFMLQHQLTIRESRDAMKESTRLESIG